MQKLLDQGKAYRCYCSAERLQKLRDKQMANKVKPRYDSYCRNLINSEQDVNKPHVIRFKNPEHDDVLWQDAVKGEIKVANKELDDLMQVSDATFLKLQKILLLFMEGKYLHTQLYQFVKGPRRI